MRRGCALGLAQTLVLVVAATPALADLTLPTGFRDSTIVSGLGLPSAMAFLPGPVEKGARVLVLEQKGQRVLQVVNGVLAPIPPFAHISEVDWVAGKLLRLDVMALPASGRGPFPHALITPADNPHVSSPDEHYRLVHSVGLRNPFRMHIDPADGAVFIADVGQVTFEGVNRITGATNLGWPWFENTTPYTTCGPIAPGGLTFPIATLSNPPSRSVISMGVYRAPPAAAEPFPAEYEGDYFFADYFSGVVRRIGFDGEDWAPKIAPGQPSAADWATGGEEIVDAAVGADGAHWYLIQGEDFAFNNGAVHRVVWRPSPPDTVTGVGERTVASIHLSSVQPNPMRDAAEFAWTLSAAGPVQLVIHDLAGRLVTTLEQGARAAGAHRSRWDGRDREGRLQPPGAYVARLTASGETRSQRFVRVR